MAFCCQWQLPRLPRWPGSRSQATSWFSVPAKCRTPVRLSPPPPSPAAGPWRCSKSSARRRSSCPRPRTRCTSSGPPRAQLIAYDLLSSYGWSPGTYFSCLNNIWTRESGWNYQAENASGAYGIPQALPASKMASAGADYLTDPKTQIIWGLGYIQGRYGNPCSAWSFWEAHGYY